MSIIDRAITDLDLRQVAQYVIGIRRQQQLNDINVEVCTRGIPARQEELTELQEAKAAGDTSVTDQDVTDAQERLDQEKRQLRGFKRLARDLNEGMDTVLFKHGGEMARLELIVDELESLERRKLLLERLELDEKLAKAPKPKDEADKAERPAA